MSAHSRGTTRLSIVLTVCCILAIVLFIFSIETVQAKSKQRKQSAETVLIVVRKKNEFPAIEVRELGNKKGRVPKRQSAPITAPTKSSIIVDENSKTENTNQQGDKRRGISKKKKQVRKKAKQEAITLMEEGETLAAEVQAVPSQPKPATSLPNKTLTTKAELEYNTKGLIIAVSIAGGAILLLALIGIIAGVAVMIKQKRNYPSSPATSGGCCGKLYDLLCCCRRAKSNYKKHDDYEESNSGAVLYQDNDMKKQLLDKLEDYEM